MGRLFKVSRVPSCAIDITNGEDAQSDGILTVGVPGTENLARCALNSSVAMVACRPIVDVPEPGSPRRTSGSECLAAFDAIGERLQVAAPDREPHVVNRELGTIDTFGPATPAVTAR